MIKSEKRQYTSIERNYIPNFPHNRATIESNIHTFGIQSLNIHLYFKEFENYNHLFTKSCEI